MGKKKVTKVARAASAKISAPKKGLLIKSAEGTRLTGLNSMPVERRRAAVDALLRTAR